MCRRQGYWGPNVAGPCVSLRLSGLALSVQGLSCNCQDTQPYPAVHRYGATDKPPDMAAHELAWSKTGSAIVVSGLGTLVAGSALIPRGTLIVRVAFIVPLADDTRPGAWSSLCYHSRLQITTHRKPAATYFYSAVLLSDAISACISDGHGPAFRSGRASLHYRCRPAHSGPLLLNS